MTVVNVPYDTETCYVAKQTATPGYRGCPWKVEIYTGDDQWRRVGRNMTFSSYADAARAIDRYDRELRDLAFLHTGSMRGVIADLNNRPPWNGKRKP